MHSEASGWTRQRIVFLGVSAALVVALLVAVRAVLMPFVLGLIIAYVLSPLVAWGERKLKLPRSVAILSVYVVVLGVVALGVAGLAPRLVHETTRLLKDAPAMARTASEQYSPRIDRFVNRYLSEGALSEAGVEPKEPEPAFVVEEHQDGSLSVQLRDGVEVVEESPGHYRVQRGNPLEAEKFEAEVLLADNIERFTRYLQTNAVEFVKVGQTIVASASRGIFMTFMVLMVAGYVMHTREKVLSFFRSLAPSVHRAGFDLLMVRVDKGLSGVVRGQLVICLVNGVLSAVGFWMFGLKYWPVLALIAAVMSIIPIFGAILSTVPAVLVGLSQDMWTALWVLLWVLGIHQVEANLLNPKIIGTSAKIHPVLVVFSLLVGEHFYGIVGALLAVPVLSMAQSVFNHFRYGLSDAAPDSLLPLPATDTPPPDLSVEGRRSRAASPQDSESS